MLVAPIWSAQTNHQEQRLHGLYETFVAPCCWRHNLNTHASPEVDQLKAQIRSLVAKGVSDEDVKAILVRNYSARILAMPEGGRAVWLVWTPLVAIAVATLALVRILTSIQTTTPQATYLPELEDWDGSSGRSM